MKTHQRKRWQTTENVSLAVLIRQQGTFAGTHSHDIKVKVGAMLDGPTPSEVMNPGNISVQLYMSWFLFNGACIHFEAMK